jgi:antitoxin (DNA-binding transcriptional repressor) of toxin-antitoxin stability system
VDERQRLRRQDQSVSAAGPRGRGEEVIITRNGRPVAKLVAATPLRKPRKLGLLKGRIRLGKDFDAPLPGDVLDAFEGKK